jgi:H+/gluconate symporter-like permease
LSTIFPAIYVDVQLVLAALLARSAAPRMRGDGLAMMSGTLTAGILVGYVFVVPGLGTVAIAGLLNVPLGTMLIFGTLIGLPTAVLTTFIYGRLLKYGLWNRDKDEVDCHSASCCSRQTRNSIPHPESYLLYGSSYRVHSSGTALGPLAH